MERKPTISGAPAQAAQAGVTRRKFLSTLTQSAVVASSLTPRRIVAAPSNHSSTRRLKIALLATEVRKYSHAQHFIDRFLEGYGWHGQHHRPPMTLAGLYVDQFPDGDLSRERARR